MRTVDVSIHARPDAWLLTVTGKRRLPVGPEWKEGS